MYTTKDKQAERKENTNKKQEKEDTKTDQVQKITKRIDQAESLKQIKVSMRTDKEIQKDK